MVTMAEGGLSVHLFNLRKLLNHRITVLSVTAVLAVYVLWQAGALVWKVWLTNHDPSQSAAVISPLSKSLEPDLLQDLLRYPLIRSASEPAAGDSDAIDAPETSLNLKLVGLVYSTDPKQARAIIDREQDGARSYSTRERVADKAEIFRIEPDRVILLHAGRREALLLDPEDATSTFQSDAKRQSPGDPDSNQSSSESPSPSGQKSARIPKKTADVMRDFSATPVMEEGQLVGFRLAALRNPEIMNEWGIDPDDVITAVNGMPLNSQGRIMVLYDKLRKQREFELTLNSGGNSRTITVDLNE
jgi:general secretion pathway protein C